MYKSLPSLQLFLLVFNICEKEHTSYPQTRHSDGKRMILFL